MENEQSLHAPTSNRHAVTALTAEQAGQVAGGTLVLGGIIRGGCQACTSGRLTAFADLAAVVNPPPEMAVGTAV